MEAIFISAASQYSNESRFINQLWQEIELAYHDKTRYYHTMKHLHHLYDELLQVKQNIKDWDTITFSIFYHDIFYSPLRKDNELKSAELARTRLASIHFPANQIEKCVKMILATKDHTASDDEDINFFTDADLSILGTNRPVYIEYFQGVKKEYAALPGIIYKAGRKSVLQQFLKMSSIFKTADFYHKYEKAARENINYELNTI